MGKYMKKTKITGDVSLMEVPQSTLGVRTRAKTLALQQNNPSDLFYLQLRNRRLHKPPPPKPPQIHSDMVSAHSRIRVNSAHSVEPDPEPEDCAVKIGSLSRGPAIGPDLDDFCVEASFGENNLEFDTTGRVTRESTPCSLTRDLDSIGTPGSAVRSTCSGAAYQRRPQNSIPRSIPSAQEIDDFFASAEMQQQKQFMEKYNFDVVHDSPLLGRYEWVRADP